MNNLKNHWILLIACIVVGIFVAFGLRSSFRSTTEPDATKHMSHQPASRKEHSVPAATGLLVDLGNDICPINKAAVNGETMLEWNHIRVHFCCPGCDTKFLRDPEGALRDAGIEFAELSDAIARFENAPPEHKQHALASIRERWTVVREP